MNLSFDVDKTHLVFLIVSIVIVSWIGLAVATTGVSHNADEIYIGAETLQNVLDTSKGTFLVKHSQTTTTPSCPSGWTELWNGYSFMSAFLSASYPGEQDLSSPGSCLSEFRAIPQIECGGTGGYTSRCDYATDGDYSMWLSTRTSDEGPITTGLEERVSRCVVCSK